MTKPSLLFLTRLACFLLFLLAAGCLSPPIAEELPDVNLPPYIAPEFVVPPDDIFLVEEPEPVALSVETLLDPNAEELLYFAFIGERSGVIEQATAARQDTGERYLDRFYYFDRIGVEVDPCDERLRRHSDETIRVFISDRPFQRVSPRGVEAADDGFVTSHRWLLRFREQLCP